MLPAMNCPSRLLCNEGKWQEAEALVDDMKRAGLRTSESGCRTLLEAKARLYWMVLPMTLLLKVSGICQVTYLLM
jgi:pentatricopeptide repeat protein